jgi:hypothetical protein
MVGDWQAAGLIKQSVLKPVFTTIEQHLVIRTMGRLNATDAKALREVIGDVIGRGAPRGLRQNSRPDPGAHVTPEPMTPEPTAAAKRK